MKNFWLSERQCTMKVWLMATDEPTFSKRIYPKPLIEQQIQAMTPVIANRGLMGHLDHQADSMIHLAHVSHLITKLELHDRQFWADIEILDTPCGKILRSLLRESYPVVFATAGVGNGCCDENGILLVSDSYKLITVNAVDKDGTSKLYKP